MSEHKFPCSPKCKVVPGANYWHDFELFSRWRAEPQTVTKHPSVNYNAATSGQEDFLAQLAKSRGDTSSKLSPKLSILIASLESRALVREALISKLRPQCANKPVEVIIEIDSGEMTVGAKRNVLLAKATGEYVVFIDDDDDVAESYIEDIFKALEQNPDCVTFKGIITTDEKSVEEFRFDMNYPHNIWEKDANGVHMRCPSIWCPIKASIAKSVKFLDIDCAEDRVWAIQLYPLLRSQFYIDKHLHYYRASSTGTEAQRADKVEKSRKVINDFRFVPFVRKSS